MNLSYRESIQFCDSNKKELVHLASTHNIVLCPSFIALAPIVEIFKNTTIAIGAQNCSEYSSGPYTGEVSAQSLSEIGITHCFVGHSERRMYFSETTDIIIKKTNLLHANNIIPIVCIGETQEHFANQATFTVLTEQIKPIIDAAQHNNKPLMIAYEPVWSIGTGIVPENSYLEEVFTWLTKLMHSYTPSSTIKLFYGGSVTTKNIHQLKNIKHIDGFLIGGASTNFQELKRIITAE
jgi:triosephosphate isomerase